MPLTSGTRLGPHEIVSPIGKGGMGEVYRARDTKLERDVAIKVLPDDLADDEKRIARFEREAKLLASLNHPNIASIYGFESGALVLELVEGPTLAERIAEGPVPVDEAIAIAKQIVEALEAGHEAGVIHRDLKPANIKLKEDGTVKVLDYGLAKALEGDAPSGVDSELSHSPTLTRLHQGSGGQARQGTQIGVILGTASYMSPEQAKGKRVDKRTDIWAFGAVLYEMLTRKRAFDGDSASDIIGSVLKLEPDWDALPPGRSPTVDRLLRRCLEKDARRRLRDIGDARIELEEAAEVSSETPIETRRTSKSASRLVGAVSIALLVGGIVAWNLKPTPLAPATDRIHFVANQSPVRADSSPALSPDGTRLAYVSERDGVRQLVVRSMDSVDVTPIADADGAAAPFFSPDGEWLGFIAGGKMKKVFLQGGGASVIADVPFPRGAASWGADGTIVFKPQPDGGLWQVSADGGASSVLTSPDAERGERSYRFPEILPDGKSVLFTVGDDTISSFDEGRIAVFSPGMDRPKILIEGGSHGRYALTGHIVYGRDGALMAAPFDVDALEVTAPPIEVLRGVVTNPIAGDAHFALSKNGTLAYVAGGSLEQARKLTWVHRDGREEEMAIEYLT